MGVMDGSISSFVTFLTKAGISLRRLIGSERLVVVFGMLSERDPDQLLGALRSLRPDAAVWREPSISGAAYSQPWLPGRCR